MSRFDLQGIGMTSQRTRDRLVERLREQGIQSGAVLAQIGQVPRHIFIDEAIAHRAYEDTALPIGHNQTISQPYIVALMTELLLDKPRAKVLEVGTGSGYQTAVLAGLCETLYSVERIQALLPRAQERLAALRLRNVKVRHSDGGEGWEANAPYDGILVTAAAQVVPQPLLEQLRVGGRMLVPVGPSEDQQLKVIDRTEDGFDEQITSQVKFVPLLGGISRS